MMSMCIQLMQDNVIEKVTAMAGKLGMTSNAKTKDQSPRPKTVETSINESIGDGPHELDPFNKENNVMEVEEEP